MAKYFKESEIKGLDKKLIYMLDNAREIAQIPFIITSGRRTIEENKRVGGVKDSAHLSGQAVDIRCPNSIYRFLILKGLLGAGFKRIGIAPQHIHADKDATKPQNVIFLE